MARSRVQTAKSSLSRSDATELGAGLALFAVVGVSAAGLDEGLRDWVFPRVITYLLAVIAAVLILRRLLRLMMSRGESEARDPGATADGAVTLRTATDVATVAGIVTLYAVLIPVLGFWTVSFFVLTAFSVFLTAGRSVRSVAVSTVFAAVVCVVAYFVFLHLFYVPVPTRF